MINLLTLIFTALAVTPPAGAQVYQMVGGLDANTSIIGNYYN
jgi:hypothetical protein